MATKKKAAPLLKLSKATLVRRVQMLERKLGVLDRVRKSEREQHLAEELDLQKVSDGYRERAGSMGLQIDKLAREIVSAHPETSPLESSDTCEIAARLLREQRDKIAKLEAVIRLHDERASEALRLVREAAEKRRREERGAIGWPELSKNAPITNADSANAQRFTREVGR